MKNSVYMIEQRESHPTCCVDCFEGEGLTGLVEGGGVVGEFGWVRWRADRRDGPDAEAGVAGLGADLRRLAAESVVSRAGRFFVEEGRDGFGGLGADLAGEGDLVELLVGVAVVGLTGGLGDTVFDLVADLVGVLLLEVERFLGVLFCFLGVFVLWRAGVGIVPSAWDCRRQKRSNSSWYFWLGVEVKGNLKGVLDGDTIESSSKIEFNDESKLSWSVNTWCLLLKRTFRNLCCSLLGVEHEESLGIKIWWWLWLAWYELEESGQLAGWFLDNNESQVSDDSTLITNSMQPYSKKWWSI